MSTLLEIFCSKSETFSSMSEKSEFIIFSEIFPQKLRVDTWKAVLKTLPKILLSESEKAYILFQEIFFQHASLERTYIMLHRRMLLPIHGSYCCFPPKKCGNWCIF